MPPEIIKVEKRTYRYVRSKKFYHIYERIEEGKSLWLECFDNFDLRLLRKRELSPFDKHNIFQKEEMDEERL